MSKVSNSNVTDENRVIQLDAKDEGGTVTVTPANEDRFNIRVKDAVAACEQWVADGQARDRFLLLLNRLQEWVLQRRDLRDAFLTVNGGSFVFLVVKGASLYDEALEDELSALDLELAHDEDIRCQVDVLALPPTSEEALRSFLNPGRAFRFKSGQGE